MKKDEISLRSVCSEDEKLLFHLFSVSRPDLEWILNADDEINLELVSQQYKLELWYIKSRYPDAKLNIILYCGEAVGRIFTYHCKDFIRIIAISVLPEYRNMGIGSRIILNLLEEAARANIYVCLNVMWYNYQARALYEKLGFKCADDLGVSCEMHSSAIDLNYFSGIINKEGIV